MATNKLMRRDLLVTKRCVSCGVEFNCGSDEENKDCWCSKLPTLKEINPNKGCYCKECLEKKLQSQGETIVQQSNNTKKSTLYTKTGDKGKTRLADGSLTEKYSIRVHAYGEIDELNCHVGIIRSIILTKKDIKKYEIADNALERIQNDCFIIGSMLAKAKNIQLHNKAISTIENFIDKFDSATPPLKNFILPGGSSLNAFSHLTRTICRRTERSLWQLSNEANETISSDILIYLNRLSDLFFAMARWFSHVDSIEEINWKP